MIKRFFCSSVILFWFSALSQNQISDILNYENEVKEISIENEQVAFVDVGSGGRTLIFIHGLSSNLQSWTKNISKLKNSYRCIALDLPGYGKSTKNRTNYSMNDYAGFLKSFIDKKNLQDLILVGHSMGGQIAAHTVLNTQVKFRSLVLIAPAGIETFTEDEAAILEASYTSEMVKASTPEQIRNNYEKNFHEFPEDAKFMVKERIAMKDAEDMNVYSEIVVNNIQAMLDEPVIDRLSEIEIPVLMIYGKKDLLIPNTYFHPSQDVFSLVETAKEKIPNLKVDLIDKAGHFVNFEKSGQVNDSIIKFLNEE